MPARPTARPAPPHADCATILPGDQFADAYAVAAPAGLDAITATKVAFTRGRRYLALVMPFHRAIAARMIEGVA